MLLCVLFCFTQKNPIVTQVLIERFEQNKIEKSDRKEIA